MFDCLAKTKSVFGQEIKEKKIMETKYDFQPQWRSEE